MKIRVAKACPRQCRWARQSSALIRVLLPCYDVIALRRLCHPERSEGSRGSYLKDFASGSLGPSRTSVSLGMTKLALRPSHFQLPP